MYYIFCEKGNYSNGIPFTLIFNKYGEPQEIKKKKHFIEQGDTLIKVFETHVQLYYIFSYEKKHNAVLVGEGKFIEGFEKKINIDKILQNLNYDLVLWFLKTV